MRQKIIDVYKNIFVDMRFIYFITSLLYIIRYNILLI